MPDYAPDRPGRFCAGRLRASRASPSLLPWLRALRLVPEMSWSEGLRRRVRPSGLPHGLVG